MIIDKAHYHANADHLLAFLTWLRDKELLVEPHPSSAMLALDLYEYLDGRLLTEHLTAEGQVVVHRVYSEFLEAWEALGASPLTWDSYCERVMPWLDGLADADEDDTWRLDVHSRLGAGLADLVTAEGMRPVKRHALAWARPAPGGWRTGFWVEVHPDQYPAPVGGAFIVRVCGGRFAVDQGTAKAPPELRLSCWIGQEGRDAMRDINEAVWAKLPSIIEWPTADAALTPPRRSYRPADEPWMRFVDGDDIDRWIEFLVARLPAVLDDIDAHYAGG